MWGVIGKVLAGRGLGRTTLAGMDSAERKALVDGLLAEAETLRERNREFSRQLVTQLAGNKGVVKLSEAPDGLGYFYGSFQDGERHYRLDVLPPRDLWSGDVNEEAADIDNWTVFVDGEEVERGQTIGTLSVIGSVLARKGQGTW